MLAEAVVTQIRVIAALVLRETRTRFGQSRIGYLWALIEPISHVAVLSAIFTMAGRSIPPVGDSLPIFFATGIMPYLAFQRMATFLTYSITANGSLLYFPAVKQLDAMIARTLLEMATMTVVVVLVTTGMILLGLSRPPHDLLETASGLLSLTLLGAGIGFINAVLQPLFATWDRMFQILTRPLYFLSGIFFVADMLPPSVRDLLAWNPVLHGVEWFRSGYFTDYSSHMLDREYILGIAFGCLFVGLAMERALRRRVRNVA